MLSRNRTERTFSSNAEVDFCFFQLYRNLIQESVSVLAKLRIYTFIDSNPVVERYTHKLDLI